MLSFFPQAKEKKNFSTRSSRAALLPTPGDPFLLNLWLKSFENIWASEVDRLYIHVNSYLAPSVIEALMKRLHRHPKIETLYDDRMIDHGNSLAKLVRHCREDLLMLIEDDAFVLKSGAVDHCFSEIENNHYDCLGSPRGSCSMKLFYMGMEKFGKPVIGYDTGPHFWPNFFFCKRADLLKTDMNFGAHHFKLGDRIQVLDYTVDEEPMNGDTFVWGSLQMRGLNLKCGYVEQHKVRPNDFDEHGKRDNCFSPRAAWFHSGNLSGSLHSWLRGRDGMPIGGSTAAAPVDMNVMPEEAKGHGLQDDFERRVTFLIIAWDVSRDEYKEMSSFKRTYKEAIDLFIKRYGLVPAKIERRKKIYMKLLKPLLHQRRFWESGPTKVQINP